MGSSVLYSDTDALAFTDDGDLLLLASTTNYDGIRTIVDMNGRVLRTVTARAGERVEISCVLKVAGEVADLTDATSPGWVASSADGSTLSGSMDGFGDYAVVELDLTEHTATTQKSYRFNVQASNRTWPSSNSASFLTLIVLPDA